MSVDGGRDDDLKPVVISPKSGHHVLVHAPDRALLDGQAAGENLIDPPALQLGAPPGVETVHCLPVNVRFWHSNLEWFEPIGESDTADAAELAVVVDVAA